MRLFLCWASLIAGLAMLAVSILDVYRTLSLGGTIFVFGWFPITKLAIWLFAAALLIANSAILRKSSRSN